MDGYTAEIELAMVAANTSPTRTRVNWLRQNHSLTAMDWINDRTP